VTRDHTERILTHLGVRVSRSANEISVWPVERIAPFDVRIAGDFSSAAPFLVAATLASGSELRIHDVNLNPTRTGFLDVLNRMGARITVYNRRNESGEPVADLEVRSAELTATEIRPEEVPNLVDELPLFALVATMARGESVVRGAEELRAKETDRIETTVDSLRALGAHITSREDGFVVRGVPTRLEGGRMHARGDHRIAMLGAVAGVLSRTGVRVEDPECVAVSFPDFFELLDSVTVVET
jgi:3-phosphoshikimate 1-carboxyvinyltransferase